jgi:hypothetical protein
MRHLFVTTFAAALLFAAPAAGARPAKAEFWNGDRENGAAFYATKHRVRELQFFCQRTRYDVENLIRVRRDGTFRYRGRMRKYGQSGQPLGFFKGTVKGRFTSRRSVTITRKLENCGRATVRATAGART